MLRRVADERVFHGSDDIVISHTILPNASNDTTRPISAATYTSNRSDGSRRPHSNEAFPSHRYHETYEGEEDAPHLVVDSKGQEIKLREECESDSDIPPTHLLLESPAPKGVPAVQSSKARSGRYIGSSSAHQRQQSKDSTGSGRKSANRAKQKDRSRKAPEPKDCEQEEGRKRNSKKQSKRQVNRSAPFESSESDADDYMRYAMESSDSSDAAPKSRHSHTRQKETKPTSDSDSDEFEYSPKLKNSSHNHENGSLVSSINSRQDQHRRMSSMTQLLQCQTENEKLRQQLAQTKSRLRQQEEASNTRIDELTRSHQKQLERMQEEHDRQLGQSKGNTKDAERLRSQLQALRDQVQTYQRRIHRWEKRSQLAIDCSDDSHRSKALWESIWKDLPSFQEPAATDEEGEHTIQYLHTALVERNQKLEEMKAKWEALQQSNISKDGRGKKDTFYAPPKVQVKAKGEHKGKKTGVKKRVQHPWV